MRSTLSRTRKLPAALTAILLGLSIFASAPQARAQLTALDKAPQGADAVLIIPSLSQLSQDIAQLSQALNLPFFNRPLRSFKLEAGIQGGLDESGALLVVVPELAQAITRQREPKLLVLVPVSNYQAFIDNFNPQSVEDFQALSLLIVRDRQQVYAKKVAGYAVLSAEKKLVQNYQPGGASEKIANKVGAAGRRYLDQSDIVFYMDMKAMRPALLELINEGVKGAMHGMRLRQDRGGGMPRQTARNFETIIKAYAEAGRALVKSTTGLLIGLDISGQGVGLTGAAGFKLQSLLADYLPGVGQNEAQRPHALAWLPDQPYVVAGAINARAVAMDAILKDMLQSGFMAVMPEQMVGRIRKNLSMYRHINAMSFAFFPPPEQPGKKGGFYNALSVIDVDNPQQYVASLKKNIQSMNGVTYSLLPTLVDRENAEGQRPRAENQPAQPDDAPVATYTTSYTDNALKINGVQVDKYHVKVDFPPELMQGIGWTEVFLQQFTNVTGYIATKGGKVIQTTSTNSQLLADALQAIQGAGGLGQTGPINEVRDRALPPSPAVQMYLSFNGLAQLVKPFMGMMGMPRIQAPDNLPPFAVGLGVEQSSVAGRVYFPMRTIQFLSETGREIMNQMTAPRRNRPEPQPSPVF